MIMEQIKKYSERCPKFKVGDRIKDRNNRVWYVVQVSDKYFDISSVPNAEGYFVPIEDQDEYELGTTNDCPDFYKTLI